MIRFRLTELVADAQFKSGKRITLLEVAQATGINRMTLSRMANVRGYSTSTETLDKLCRYFGCTVGDLAQYVEDPSISSPADAAKAEVAKPAKPSARKRSAARAPTTR
jgi:putative transcriptional regulator